MFFKNYCAEFEEKKYFFEFISPFLNKLMSNTVETMLVISKMVSQLKNLKAI